MATLFAVLVTSCTSAPDGALDLGMPAYNAAGTGTETNTATNDPMATGSALAVPQPVMSAEGDTELPREVAHLPAANPAAAVSAAPPVVATAADGEAEAAKPDTVADDLSQPPAAEAAEAAAGVPVPMLRTDVAATTAAPASAAVAEAASGDGGQVIATAAEWPQEAIAPKKKGFLSSFFGATPNSARPLPTQRGTAEPVFRNAAKPLIDPGPAEPVVQIATAGPAPKPLVMASLGNDNALPGVRQTALFEITRKSGLDDDSDVDLHEDEDGGPVRLASAAGLARLAPNGLLKQTETVDVACLKPSLVRVLKTIEAHYGKKIMVTSGYRNPSHNRRARGAKNSLHMYCAAADIQLPGVAKWELASYVRSMPGRGGVGTYCHTDSVHVDVGPERDWNWRCRRRK